MAKKIKFETMTLDEVRQELSMRVNMLSGYVDVLDKVPQSDVKQRILAVVEANEELAKRFCAPVYRDLK